MSNSWRAFQHQQARQRRRANLDAERFVSCALPCKRSRQTNLPAAEGEGARTVKVAASPFASGRLR